MIMGYMIEITEDKLGTLAENAEKMLRYGGKIMQCIDEMQRGGSRMGERHYDDYRTMGGDRGRYGMRGEWNDDDDDRYGERGYRRRY